MQAESEKRAIWEVEEAGGRRKDKRKRRGRSVGGWSMLRVLGVEGERGPEWVWVWVEQILWLKLI